MVAIDSSVKGGVQNSQDYYDHKNREMKIGNDIYEIPTDQAVAVSNAITYAWSKLGKPETPFSESGRKLMQVIFAAWEDTYPFEYQEWKGMRDEYQGSEMDISEQVSKQTGRTLAAYPMFVLQLIKKLFPNFDPIQRDNCIKMAREYPMLRMANRI